MISLSLAQRRAIDRAKEGLVQSAETLLRDAEVEPTPKFGHSQLRNLIAVAMETESPAVVVNFIRYQMGRDDYRTPTSWAKKVGGKRLGELFIDELETGAVASALATVPGLEGDAVAKQLARIELIRHFLGFTSRYFKFRELEAKANRADQESEP